jgi:hypothetical protein
MCVVPSVQGPIHRQQQWVFSAASTQKHSVISHIISGLADSQLWLIVHRLTSMKSDQSRMEGRRGR